MSKPVWTPGPWVYDENMRLVSAAPELYAALQELVTLLTEQHSAPEDVEAAFEQARSALATARGETQ